MKATNNSKNSVYKFSSFWTIKQKIDFLQRVILIHSYLYYELDNPVWSDKDFDSVAKQLADLQHTKDEEWIADYTQYGYTFYDFDGTTGFDLWSRLSKPHKKQIKEIITKHLGR